MIRRFRDLTVLTLVFSLNTARAADGPPVTPFEADGVVVNVLELFPCAIKDEKKADRARTQTTLKEVAARALVTKDGVYAFLETPENKRALRGVKTGTAVSIKGRLLTSGRSCTSTPSPRRRATPALICAVRRRGRERGHPPGCQQVPVRPQRLGPPPLLHAGAPSPPGGRRRKNLSLSPVWRGEGGVPGRRNPLQECGGEGASVPGPVLADQARQAPAVIAIVGPASLAVGDAEEAGQHRALGLVNSAAARSFSDGNHRRYSSPISLTAERERRSSMRGGRSNNRAAGGV